jgi:hypothetical protein
MCCRDSRGVDEESRIFEAQILCRISVLGGFSEGRSYAGSGKPDSYSCLIGPADRTFVKRGHTRWSTRDMRDPRSLSLAPCSVSFAVNKPLVVVCRESCARAHVCAVVNFRSRSSARTALAD